MVFEGLRDIGFDCASGEIKRIHLRKGPQWDKHWLHAKAGPAVTRAMTLNDRAV